MPKPSPLADLAKILLDQQLPLTTANVLKVAVMVDSAPLKESTVLSDVQAPAVQADLSKQRFAGLLLELNHV